jgi:uroporphyrinogen III methyltransferase/synthase
MKRRRKGKVYLVGAGPGDPELITVKGLKLIQKADVIVYDFLINKELLAFARKDAELICVGKSSSYHTMKQEEINKLLAEKANQHQIVVRLKNGDPFVFGRGAEESIYLSEQNIPFEVVSGVSSAIAVPASAGVPLTHRDYASSVAIITGHRRDDGEVKIANADTLVFLMPVANLERIIQKLLEGGKSPETPCVLIEKGTLPGQKVAQGNLANIVENSKAKGVKAPAVFVVGEIVSLRNSLDQT